MSELEQQPSQPAARILLVDDTELNRDVFGRVLMAAGYAVDVASDGAEACEAAWSTSYDLVLMDIEMPGMSGFEAAARIRAREGVMSGVKIVALTATRQPDAEEVSFWSGIDEFIAKPIASAPLLARVAALLSAGTPVNDDWKPVWRLGTFATFSEGLEETEQDRLLQKFALRLEEAAVAIQLKATCSDAFYGRIRALLRQSSVLGFEEIAGLCKLYEATRGDTELRCRDPNLLGAIDRARYAIKVYQPEAKPAAAPDWWSRMRVNVQSLFRSKPPAPIAPAAFQAFEAPSYF